MKKLITWMICLSCLPCMAEKPTPERTCRLIYLERPVGAPEEGYLFDGKNSHQVSFSSMNFSDEIKLPEGDLILGLTSNAVASLEEFPKGAPKIKIPAAIRDLYLILAQDTENKILPIKIIPINVSSERIKPGETLWINLTKHRIGAKLGNEEIVIDANTQKVSKLPQTQSGYFKARFVYQPQSAGKYLPIMNKSWWHDASSKNLGFIIDSGGRLPGIFTFRDHRVAPEEKADDSKAEVETE